MPVLKATAPDVKDELAGLKKAWNVSGGDGGSTGDGASGSEFHVPSSWRCTAEVLESSGRCWQKAAHAANRKKEMIITAVRFIKTNQLDYAAKVQAEGHLAARATSRARESTRAKRLENPRTLGEIAPTSGFHLVESGEDRATEIRSRNRLVTVGGTFRGKGAIARSSLRRRSMARR